MILYFHIFTWKHVPLELRLIFIENLGKLTYYLKLLKCTHTNT